MTNDRRSLASPPRIHIVGRKNSGKTTLVEQLIAQLSAEGFRVGAIKHTHHRHELDTPGKDSHRHGQAGAAVVGILTRDRQAVFWPRPAAAEASREPAAGEADSNEQSYAAMAPLFADCDLILVEGDSQTAAPKVEVWRAATGAAPIGQQDETIKAFISDDPPPPLVRAEPISRADLAAIARMVKKLAQIPPDRQPHLAGELP